MLRGSHLLTLWLGLTLTLDLVQAVFPQHRSGWAIHPPALATRQILQVWHLDPTILDFTAQSSSPRVFATTSLCSAPLPAPPSLWFLSWMHADTHERWLLQQLQAPPALLPGRRASRRILTPWTKVPAPLSEASLITAGQPPLQPGTLHSARCWRFTSVRCCAPSERHVRVGMRGCGPHFPCASCLRPPCCSPCSVCLTQVPPLLLAPAASLACHYPGALVHRDGITGTRSFWEQSHSHPIGYRVIACSALSLGSLTAPWPGMYNLCSGLFGSRNELLQGMPDQVGSQAHVHSNSSQMTAFGLQALVTLNPWTAPGDFRLSRVWVVGFPRLQVQVNGLKGCSGPCPCGARMAKRGKRSGRRRRPRDTARESRRPPKRLRGTVADAADEVDGQSSESSDGISPSIDSEPALAAARPLTVFSVAADDRIAATGSSDLRPRDDVEDGCVFHEHDLRVERSPDEFLAIAASLGRDYATPTVPRGDHRADSAQRHSTQNMAASSARVTPAPMSSSIGSLSARRPLIPQITPRRGVIQVRGIGLQERCHHLDRDLQRLQFALLRGWNQLWQGRWSRQQPIKAWRCAPLRSRSNLWYLIVEAPQPP